MAELLDYNLDEVPELKTLPDGEEVQVRIVKGSRKDSKKGDPMVEVVLDTPAYTDVAYIYHYIMLPNDKMDKRQKENALRNIKTFKEAFDLPWPLDPDQDLSGQTTWAILKEEDGDIGLRNSIKKFVGKA